LNNLTTFNAVTTVFYCKAQHAHTSPIPNHSNTGL